MSSVRLREHRVFMFTATIIQTKISKPRYTNTSGLVGDLLAIYLTNYLYREGGGAHDLFG